MKIAVLSGKGGAGKTFVAVNLAYAAGETYYIDCDVEEPNGELFFKPRDTVEERVSVMTPVFDAEKCTGCKECVNFCRYNALALVRGKVMLFREVCHACGGCVLICPQEAAGYSAREIGTIRQGSSGKVRTLSGLLDTGEVSGVPIIKMLNRKTPRKGITVIDCPPGSSCLVMESIKEADYCVLVAEPTSFGVHDLKMALELTEIFNKPFGVVLNKCLPEENPARDFCLGRGIAILAEIPFDRETRRSVSSGEVVSLKNPFLKTVFMNMMAKIKKEVRP